MTTHSSGDSLTSIHTLVALSELSGLKKEYHMKLDEKIYGADKEDSMRVEWRWI